MKELNNKHIESANNNSQFNRGTNTNKSYTANYNYINENTTGILTDKFINKLYDLYSDLIYRQSIFVSWNVSGRANYNTSKANKQIDKITEVQEKINKLLEEVENYINNKKASDTDYNKDKIKEITSDIDYWINTKSYTFARDKIIALLKYDIKLFEEYYHKLDAIKPIRKNTNLYKLYINRNQQDTTKETITVTKFETYEIIVNNDKQRVFIKNYSKPKPQLRYALKSRGFYWNHHESAWATRISKYTDELKQWAESLETNYAQYL